MNLIIVKADSGWDTDYDYDFDYDYDYDLGKWVTTYEEIDYLENISFEFTISSKDKMPKPNKDFNSILEISESDLDKIIKKIEEDTIN